VTALVIGIALIAVAVAVLSWVLRQAKDGRRG
jgi:multisubunit Na+/H+ antiporter MnhC subunit